MGDNQLKTITSWLLTALSDKDAITYDDLLKRGDGQYSPSDITWAIWYLKSEGKLRLTGEDRIAAA